MVVARERNGHAIYWNGHLYEGDRLVPTDADTFVLWKRCERHGVPRNAARAAQMGHATSSSGRFSRAPPCRVGLKRCGRHGVSRNAARAAQMGHATSSSGRFSQAPPCRVGFDRVVELAEGGLAMAYVACYIPARRRPGGRVAMRVDCKPLC
jgi:hypothetical protein